MTPEGFSAVRTFAKELAGDHLHMEGKKKRRCSLFMGLNQRVGEVEPLLCSSLEKAVPHPRSRPL